MRNGSGSFLDLSAELLRGQSGEMPTSPGLLETATVLDRLYDR
jgi:hypothetical protein